MKIKVFGSRLSRSFGGDMVMLVFLVLAAAFMALPLIYVIMSSFKPYEEIFIFPPRFFVKNPTTENFYNMFALSSNLWVPFTRYIFNSMFVSVMGTTAQVLICSMAAYPLAKHQFRGKNIIFSIIILALLFTPQVTFLPQYVILSKLGMINTYLSIILPPLGAAFGLFLMKQFMETIPISLIEASRIDGANELKTFWSIVMPNVKPAWLTLIVFSFQAYWNNNGNSFLYNESLKLLPSALQQIATAGIARFGVGMATTVVLMIPPITIFILTQSNIIETMAQAGIKE